MNKKISYYFMDDKGVRQVELTPNEYNKFLNNVYDKEKILSYMEDELVLFGMPDLEAYILTNEARKNHAVLEDLNQFMKETVKTKRAAIVADIFKKMEYETNNS